MRIEEFIAARIKELRTLYGTKGLSQSELANMVGTTANTVSRWETGRYRPAVSDLDKLAKALEVPIRNFFPKEEFDETSGFAPLFRAVEGLSEKDVEAVQEYAEFRKARSLLKKKSTRPSPGRKPNTGE